MGAFYKIFKHFLKGSKPDKSLENRLGLQSQDLGTCWLTGIREASSSPPPSVGTSFAAGGLSSAGHRAVTVDTALSPAHFRDRSGLWQEIPSPERQTVLGLLTVLPPGDTPTNSFSRNQYTKATLSQCRTLWMVFSFKKKRQEKKHFIQN